MLQNMLFSEKSCCIGKLLQQISLWIMQENLGIWKKWSLELMITDSPFKKKIVLIVYLKGSLMQTAGI